MAPFTWAALVKGPSDLADWSLKTTTSDIPSRKAEVRALKPTVQKPHANPFLIPKVQNNTLTSTPENFSRIFEHDCYYEPFTTYIALDFEGAYTEMARIREVGLVIMHMDHLTISLLKNNPKQLPSTVICRNIHVLENAVAKQDVPWWAKKKGLVTKPFVFGKEEYAHEDELDEFLEEVIEQERQLARKIVLVTYAGGNEERYCAMNEIFAFGDLWDNMLDTQDLYKGKTTPSLMTLAKEVLGIEKRILHNAGNDAAITLLLAAQAINQEILREDEERARGLLDLGCEEAEKVWPALDRMAMR